MRTGVVIALVVVAAAAPRAGQNTKKPGEKPVITVTGCLDGTWLEVKTTGPGAYAERYRLTGSKTLLKEMTSRYKHHVIEVTGTVTDVSDSTHMGKTVEVGKKMRITTGAKEVPQVPKGENATLEVGKFKEIEGSCR